MRAKIVCCVCHRVYGYKEGFHTSNVETHGFCPSCGGDNGLALWQVQLKFNKYHDLVSAINMPTFTVAEKKHMMQEKYKVLEDIKECITELDLWNDRHLHDILLINGGINY